MVGNTNPIDNNKPINQFPLPPENEEKNEPTKESLVVKEVLTSSTDESQNKSSWLWDWTIGPIVNKTKNILTSDIVLSTAINTIGTWKVSGFNASELIEQSRMDMTEATGDPKLFNFAEFLGQSVSQAIWPSQKAKIKELLKDVSIGETIIQFIDANQDIIGDIIKVNVIAIIGNLGKSFTPSKGGSSVSNIFLGLSKIIDEEIELVSKETEGLSEEEKQKRIQTGLQNVSNKIILAAFPKGAESVHIPDVMGYGSAYVFPHIKDQISGLVKTLYNESIGNLDQKKQQAEDNLKKLTGLDNVDQLGTIPSSMAKEFIKKQLSNKEALQNTVEEAISSKGRNHVAAEIVNAIQNVYEDKSSARVGSALMNLLDTNFIVLLSTIGSKATEGKEEVDQKELLANIFSFWIGKAKEFAKSDSKPISDADWKEFLKDLPLPLMFKDQIPALVDSLFPRIETKLTINPKPDFQRYVQAVGTIIEEVSSENEASRNELKDQNLDEVYTVSNVIDYSKVYLGNNAVSLKQTINQQVQNLVKDDKTSEWISDNILTTVEQALASDNTELSQALKAGINLADGFLAKTLNTLTKNTSAAPLLPGFVSTLNDYLRSNPIKLSVGQTRALREAFALRKKIADETDPQKKELLILEMQVKAAPLMKIIQDLSEKFFDAGDLSKITYLDTLRKETLPQLLFDQFGEMALSLIEITNSEELLDEAQLKQCDEWANEIVDQAKQGVNFKEISQGIAETLLGKGKDPDQVKGRKKLAEQLEAILKNQDDPLVWNLASQVIRASLIHSMATITFGTADIINVRAENISLQRELQSELEDSQDALRFLNLSIEPLKDQKNDLVIFEQLVQLELERQQHSKYQADLLNQLDECKTRMDEFERRIADHDPLLNFGSKVAETIQKALTDPPLSKGEIYTIKRIFRLRQKNLFNIESDLKLQEEKIKELKAALANPDPTTKIDFIKKELRNLEFKQRMTLKGKAAIERKIEESMKPLLGRFQAISDEVLSSVGLKDTLPVPDFIKATLKEKLLPTLIFDQSGDMLFLHAERASIVRSLESHKRGQGVLELAKFATGKVMDIIKGSVIDSKSFAEEINSAYGLNLSDEQIVELGKKIDGIENKDTLELDDLVNIVKPFTPPEIDLRKGKLREITVKINSSTLTVGQLGEMLNDMLKDNKLTGLSESQRKSLEEQIAHLIKNEQPPIVWEFLNNHIELILLKVFNNLGKSAPGEDIIVTTTKKLQTIFNNNLNDKPDIEQFKKITNEILTLAGVDDTHPIPGVPLATQKLLLSLVKDKAPPVLSNIYRKKLSLIQKGTTEKLPENPQEVLVNNFGNAIGDMGTKAVFDILFDKEENFIKLSESVLPQGGTQLGESLTEAWGAISGATSTEKEETVKEVKEATKTIFKSIATDLLNYILGAIQKESLEANTNLFIQFIDIVTKLLNNQLIDKQQLDEKEFFADISKEALDVIMPKGIESPWMNLIPEGMQKPIWGAIKNIALPAVFKSIVESLITPATLRGLWIKIFKSVNETLEAPIDFNKPKTEAPVKSKEEKELTNSEKLLNKKCGEAFIALTNVMLPQVIAGATKSYGKDMFAELVGSAIRGMLTQTFWMDLIKPQIENAIKENMFTYNPTAEKVDAAQLHEQQNKEIDAEIHKTMNLLYTYPLKYVWAKVQQILDSVFALGGGFGIEFKRLLDTSCRFVFITVIGTVLGWIIYPITWIRQQILNYTIDKQRTKIRVATEDLLKDPEMQRKVFAKMWDVFFHPKTSEDLLKEDAS